MLFLNYLAFLCWFWLCFKSMLFYFCMRIVSCCVLSFWCCFFLCSLCKDTQCIVWFCYFVFFCNTTTLHCHTPKMCKTESKYDELAQDYVILLQKSSKWSEKAEWFGIFFGVLLMVAKCCWVLLSVAECCPCFSVLL